MIENKYEIGDIIYLKTDKEQLPRIVLSFKVFKNGELLYELGQGINTSAHYEFEISREANVLMTTTN